jgi:hypothetical protein
MSVAMVGAGIAAVGTLNSMGAADDAVNAQRESGRQANAMTEAALKQQREDLAPWRESGGAAANALAFRLGLGGGMGADYRTKEQIKNSLLSQYTKGGSGVGGAPSLSGFNYSPNEGSPDDRTAAIFNYMYGQQPQSTIDEAGLNAATERAWADQEARAQAARSDPSYGSLLRDFTKEDLNNDVVYNSGLQFGLNTGINQLNNRAAAAGGYGSGAALKALTRYGNDYGSTKAEGAYNRFSGNKDRTYSFLSGVSQQGQNAAANTGAAGIVGAQSMGENVIGGGNAQAAGIVSNANALSTFDWNKMLSGFNKPKPTAVASSEWSAPNTNFSPNYSLF